MSENWEERPWGKFCVIQDKDNYKIKKLSINPKSRISYQFHKKRSEVWIVVSGIASVIINDKESDYSYGQVIEIPVGSKHRIENKTNNKLEIIEIQHGTYFGEDDIVRIEDDWGRK